MNDILRTFAHRGTEKVYTLLNCSATSKISIFKMSHCGWRYVLTINS